LTVALAPVVPSASLALRSASRSRLIVVRAMGTRVKHQSVMIREPGVERHQDDSGIESPRHEVILGRFVASAREGQHRSRSI
jgi:hypothetical protein